MMETKQETPINPIMTQPSKHMNGFIAKTYHIVNSDEPTACWVKGGECFLILDRKEFSQTVLPKYFKHCKFTSFVRQLNFYGFHKIRLDPTLPIGDDGDSDSTKAQINEDIVCFHHKYFQADRPDLLKKIHRGKGSKQATAVREKKTHAPKKRKGATESIQSQLVYMKEYMDLMRNEFEVKLASTRKELELDYLCRIRAIEMCYKDMATTMVPTHQTVPSQGYFQHPLHQQKKVVSGECATPFHPGAPRGTTQAGPQLDYLVEHSLNLVQKNKNRINSSSKSSRENMYGYMGRSCSSDEEDNEDDASVRTPPQQASAVSPLGQNGPRPSNFYVNGLQLLKDFREKKQHRNDFAMLQAKACS